MSERVLVLGGGGPVGIAWEVGLLAGMAEKGVNLESAGRTIGTSAGSFVGASLASGRAPAALVESVLAQAARDREASNAGAGGAGGAPPDLTPLFNMMSKRPADREPGRELLAEIGRFAASARTIPQEAFVASFGFIAKPGSAWPKGFACTAVDIESGDFAVWDEASGVSLGAAIASSCSVPGIFPPIAIKGRRYMDGGMRSPTNFDLAKGAESVLAIAVLTNAATDFLRSGMARELDVLREAGARVELVTPDENCRDAFGPNLMDGSRRGDVVAAGLAQGRSVASRVAGFWK
jgi:NTE family protein